MVLQKTLMPESSQSLFSAPLNNNTHTLEACQSLFSEPLNINKHTHTHRETEMYYPLL